MSQSLITLLAGALILNGEALHVDSTQALRGVGEMSFPLDSTWLAREIEGGFPGKPGNPSGLVTSVEAPCSADAFLGFNEAYTSAGFGSKVNNGMNQLAVAAYGNFSVAVSGKGHFFETWNSFFTTSLPVCIDDRIVYDARIEGMQRKFFSKLAQTDEEYVSAAKRAIYATYYTYTEDTKNHIDETLKSYGLPNHHHHHKYFGVHIRRGDKVSESSLTDPEVYANVVTRKEMSSAIDIARSAAKHIIAANYRTIKYEQIRTVWLATLDGDAESVFREVLGADYEIKSLNQTAGDWHSSAHSQYYPGSASVYDILTDVEALRRSHTFIGTGSSNIGRLVYFLRQPGSNSISLDESFLSRAG